ncbi:39S ribosomal protein L17, mitochondrial [Latimeria chalumnae]|uniref:Large ribosomal subunit protein bL17m n=1 Tax=Latimeria chalumnae TaxID=7897 RepID=H3B668_LATCH|nr:PREDICTED: 39S ribosomal protein L17, mitochondrial [Latimeria chalumnae]|eukprot:XP_005999192.1 PREDICTED: 39S ribosomal protein L17, mitochondrial [Latimeria chalumnae]
MLLSLPLAVSHGRVTRRFGLGPRSRLDLLRNLLTGLVRHERIQTTRARARELQGYAEKIIDYAKYGDTNEKAMKIANFWLTEKDLIHKLFKVLVPRFQSYDGRYTRMFQIPNRENLDKAKMAVIEYKGNTFPPLITQRRDSDKTLLNQLLKGYREEMLAVRAVGQVEDQAGTVTDTLRQN